jgi:hypothetical protein
LAIIIQDEHVALDGHDEFGNLRGFIDHTHKHERRPRARCKRKLPSDKRIYECWIENGKIPPAPR